jgi:hypothetical protein
MERVPFELLVDLAEGRLAPLEAAAVRAQLAGDPVAQQQLAELEQLIGLMHADDGVDAPEHVINRALRLARKPAPPPGKLQRLIALIRSDSWQTPGLAPGLRSLHAWPRALLMRAGDREIDLQVAPRGEQWQISGQVLGPESPGTAILSGPAAHVTATLNELGEFTLPTVVGGRYTLTITQGDLEIVVPNLEIGPSSSMR